MELLCALLTGFFLWLLVFHWRRKSMGRLRELAGNLVFAAKSTRPRRVRRAFFVYFILVMLFNVFAVLTGRRLGLGEQYGSAVVFAITLMLGIPTTANIALEVRELGVLCGRGVSLRSTGGLLLVPWNQIATCQWGPSFGRIWRLDEARSCLTIARDAVPPEQKTAVTAAVGQFVPVYNCDGTLLAKPDQEHCDTKRMPWPSLDGPRFQFDLQTMLLLVVVVACAANLFGLRYRSPHYQALATLEAFRPKIHQFKDDVWELDFSACANKPTDDDLVFVEPLSELVELDLAGAPITDAGLAHLKGLKNLRHLNLANTRATSQGMEDLRRALPDASINKWVQWIPPGVVPLAPTSPKGKRRP